MTAVSLRTIKLRPGEQFEEVRAVELEPFALGGQTYLPEPASPEATLTITRMTSGFLLRLRLAVELIGPCVRCLGDARVEIAIDATELQAAKPESEELTTPYVVEGKLDLSQWARDAVALALPDRILCREDCAGICPVCGLDLNREPHEHAQEVVDPRWAKLSELRDRT
jgi:uncharacterized protein